MVKETISLSKFNGAATLKSFVMICLDLRFYKPKIGWQNISTSQNPFKQMKIVSRASLTEEEHFNRPQEF